MNAVEPKIGEVNPDRFSRLAGALLFASGMIFILMNTVAQSLYPSYSVGKDALSDLGALGSATALLWNGQLFVAGTLSLIGIVILFYLGTYPPVPRRRVTGVIYVIAALGAVVVSFVPENLNIVIHSTGAFMNFIFGGVGAIYAARFIRGGFRYFSASLGVITLASITMLQHPGALGFGGVERLVVYPVVIWNMGFGAYLMRA